MQPKVRNTNWTKDEDEALCKAWLRVSEDAATGIDQPRARLWDRIWEEFNQIIGYETERISSALMHRWSNIQSQVKQIFWICSDHTKSSNQWLQR